MKIQTDETNKKTEEFRLLNETQPSNFVSEISMLYKALSKTMNLTAKRTETEVELFSQLYSVGINAFEKLLINLNLHNLKFEDFGNDANAIKQVPSQMDTALTQFINLRDTLKSMPSYSHNVFKEAKNQYIEVLDLLIHEVKDASEMTKKIFDKIP